MDAGSFRATTICIAARSRLRALSTASAMLCAATVQKARLLALNTVETPYSQLKKLSLVR